MITIENAKVDGFEPAIRGMRNPMNSWDKLDSTSCYSIPCSKCYDFIDGVCTHETPGCSFVLGDKDLELALKLARNGPVHAKYRRMIVVWADIVAPLYWWKEMETYKVGTACNSCSTMHKICEKEFTLEDFSHEHMETKTIKVLEDVVGVLNEYRDLYVNHCSEKKNWWQLIQLLPSSYNQRRTMMMNYEVLSNIYHSRRFHRLDEWEDFCKWIETLPYSEIITYDIEN